MWRSVSIRVRADFLQRVEALDGDRFSRRDRRLLGECASIGTHKFTRRQAKPLQQLFGDATNGHDLVGRLSDFTLYDFDGTICVLFGYYIADGHKLNA